jgi:hypothetical protein
MVALTQLGDAGTSVVAAISCSKGLKRRRPRSRLKQELTVNWLGWMFALAVAAFTLAAVTDARMSKCTNFTAYSVLGLCTAR